MQSVPSDCPSVNVRRPRKPLSPVEVSATLEATIADLIAGHAVLSIVRGDDTDRDVRLYWVKAHLNAEARITGFELSVFGTDLRYDLPADLSSCDCPDQIYREERPGGCRHAGAAAGPRRHGLWYYRWNT